MNSQATAPSLHRIKSTPTLLLHMLHTYHQANKGIYLERTPAETAVERAHLVHTLKHGLAHRPDLEELSHKGVYLEVSARVRVRVVSEDRGELAWLDVINHYCSLVVGSLAALLSCVLSIAALSAHFSFSSCSSLLALRSRCRTYVRESVQVDVVRFPASLFFIWPRSAFARFFPDTPRAPSLPACAYPPIIGASLQVVKVSNRV